MRQNTGMHSNETGHNFQFQLFDDPFGKLRFVIETFAAQGSNYSRLATNAFKTHKNKSNINKSQSNVSDVPMDAIDSWVLNELTQSVVAAQFPNHIFEVTSTKTFFSSSILQFHNNKGNTIRRKPPK